MSPFPTLGPAIVLAFVFTASAAAADLKSPADFSSIGNPSDRARALFTEAGRVLQHPRCVNCHPVGDRPTQGLDEHPHSPPVFRGIDVAPREMAWQAKSLGEICEQIKDPRRNGGKTLAQIQDHMAHDSLVGWGWMPGGTREPAPGTQEQLGALIDAWIQAGAACPAR